MKKLTSILLVSIAVSTSAYAQVRFMPKAGVTLTNVAFSDVIKNSWGADFGSADFGSKVGFIAGIAAEIPLGQDMWAIQGELLWHQKGYSYEYRESGYSEDYNYTFNYLELPVLAKIKTGNVFFLLGPSVGYGIIGQYKGTYTENGSNKVDDSDWIYFGGEPSDYEYVYNALDIGIQAGAGIEIEPFVVELRYGFGLTNLYDEPPGLTGDVKSQYRSLQLTVGFPFGGKK